MKMENLGKFKAVKRYTKEQLIEYIRSFVKEHGRIPEVREFSNNPKYPGSTTYIYRFGSWNKSIELAGFDCKSGGQKCIIKDEELLDCLVQFNKIMGRPPKWDDFEIPRHNTLKYSDKIYHERFGGIQKSLKLLGLDVDSMVQNGIVHTTHQKARLFELKVKNHFEKESIDLSGENINSPYDGVCPTGQIYDAKSSKLYDNEGKYWLFRLLNKQKDKIQWYYLGAFNEDYSKLLYVWRISSNVSNELINNSGDIRININKIKNMNQFDISDRFELEE